MHRRTADDTTWRASSRVPVGRDGGAPLDPDSRSVMEARFGHDFGRVRIHDDEGARARAAADGARAVTEGDDVTLGASATDPGARNRTLAHELAHVVQQSLPGPVESVSRVEAEAETVAARVSRGQRAGVALRAPGVALFQDERADESDRQRGTGRTLLSPDLGRLAGRQRTESGLEPGQLLNRADTEAMLQSEIADLRPTIPAWTDTEGMAGFDSWFYGDPRRFDFRGNEMDGWEVNYYFVSMAMAHQGWDWNETQAIIWSWNKGQSTGLITGGGDMTPQMWFAAEQGFRDEQARLAREALGGMGVDAFKSPAAPPAVGAGGPSMSPAPP